MEATSEDGTPLPASRAKPGRLERARGDRVKAAIGQVGTAKDLSRLSGVPYGTVTNYTDGGEMKLSNAAAIARAAGVRLEWLATGEGPMTASVLGAMQAGDELAGDDTARLQLARSVARRGVAEPGGTPGGQATLGLSWEVNVDRLARAYQTALQGIAVRPGRAPDPRRLMQVTLLIYDEMTDAEAASKPPATQD